MIARIPEAALVIVGPSSLEQALANCELKPKKQVAKRLDVDASDLNEAVQQAVKDVGAS